MTIHDELSRMEANKNVIPDYCMTFSESASYVIEYADSEYNKLFKAVGIEELAVMESTGSQIIYEGVNLKELKDKVVAFFKKVWQAIKDLYTRIIGWFIARTKEGKEKIGNLSKEEIEKYLAADKSYGKVTNWNAFDFFKSETQVPLIKDAIEGIDIEGKYKAIAKKYANEDGTAKEANSDEFKSEVEKTKEEIFQTVTNKFYMKSDNVVDFKKKFSDRFKTEKIDANKEFVLKHLDEINGVVKGGKSAEKVKKLYDAHKKMIEDFIKGVEDAFKDAQFSLVAKDAMESYKQVNAVLTVVTSLIQDFYKKQFVEYFVLSVRVFQGIKAGKKEAEKKEAAEKKEDKKDEKKEEAKNESVDFVSEAFNW